jgi:hypothetical protein
MRRSGPHQRIAWGVGPAGIGDEDQEQQSKGKPARGR